MPLRLGEEVIGLLTVSRAEAGPLPSEIRELMAHVADSLAVAIYNARLHQELETSRLELRALSHRLVEMQERERGFVADQLFNQIGQVLAALKLQLQTLRPAVRSRAGSIPAPGRDPGDARRSAAGAAHPGHRLAPSLP